MRVTGASVDPDLADAPHGRTRAREVALVFAGGFIGTLARYGLTAAVPSWGPLPLSTLVVNVVGAFLLGLLVEVLAGFGPETGWRRDVKVFAGTGILGGFTTYSALAADAEELFRRSELGWGAFYALETIVIGLAATVAGVALGRFAMRRRRR